MTKCERCGQPATDQQPCWACSTNKKYSNVDGRKFICHDLCADCIATYKADYWSEEHRCFLTDPVMRKRK